MNKRKRILNALKAAKGHLSTTYAIGTQEQYICFALYRGVKWSGSSYEGYLDAKDMILARLGHFNCVEDWLRMEGVGAQSYRAALEENQNVVQEYRHRWLDALIEEFSSPA